MIKIYGLEQIQVNKFKRIDLNFTTKKCDLYISYMEFKNRQKDLEKKDL